VALLAKLRGNGVDTPMAKQKIAIAWQGGGSQTAFTAGVLAAFFEVAVQNNFSKTSTTLYCLAENSPVISGIRKVIQHSAQYS